MRPTFSVADVRAAEAELMAHESHPDELMRLAARAVAATAKAMLGGCDGPVLVLAGPGGNGGDGLYAAALLRRQGIAADAVQVAGAVHSAASAALSDASGNLLPHLPPDLAPALVIDAIAGLGSARPLDSSVASFLEQTGAPVLAVDVPTGINADTGEVAARAVKADVTITFGWARTAHALAPECGLVVISDLRLPGAPQSFAEILSDKFIPNGHIAYEPTMDLPYNWPAQPVLAGVQGFDVGFVSFPKPVGCTGPIVDPTPGMHSDKYSGGVVALAAGSAAYPGAGLLCAAGALGATASMVRCVSADPLPLVTRHPELVVHPDIAHAGRAQAWVVGPGRGTDSAAADELAAILDLGLPTIIDADAITLLSTHPDLRAQVAAHPLVVLTPHAGEFARLYAAVFPDAAPSELRTDPASARQRLADALGCFILHKGRITTVNAPGQPVFGVNAGHSYAATPGSGDVLAGVLGAVLAQMHLDTTLSSSTDPCPAPANATSPGALHPALDSEHIIMEILHAVALHAHAAEIAARTPEGYGIARASDIARALPQSIARLLLMAR